jgi:hypothetical protein
MTMTEKYTLMCDDVRLENNGKFLIIGMYTGGITVPQFPFPCGLTFLSVFDVDRLGNYMLRAKIENAESGRVIAQQVVMLDITQMPTMPSPALTVIRFPAVTLESAGAYTMSMTVESQANPVVIFPFNVILVIPPQLQQRM